MIPEDLGVVDFQQLVYLYQASHTMEIIREARGDEVREHIYQYLHRGALRVDEFVMVHELLAFEPSMPRSAKHCTVFRIVKNGETAVPDLEKIMEWCEANGQWEEFVAIRKEVEAKFAEQKKRVALEKETLQAKP